MGKTLYNNFAKSTLLNAITASAVAASCKSGDASKFDSPTGGQFFWLVFSDTSGNYEITKCTARSGSSMTITRGQQGTTQRAWSAGTIISVRPTAADMETIPQGLTVETDSWTPGAIANGAEAAKDITVTEAEMGDFVLRSISVDIQDLVLDAQVTAANTVTVVLSNTTGGAVDLGTFDVYVRVIKK